MTSATGDVIVAIGEYPLIHPSAGQQVQNPAVIIAGTHAALFECLADARCSSVVATSLSAAMHGLIALERPMTVTGYEEDTALGAAPESVTSKTVHRIARFPCDYTHRRRRIITLIAKAGPGLPAPHPSSVRCHVEGS